jgi:thiol-disulfide isomerase/thioredoxin
MKKRLLMIIAAVLLIPIVLVLVKPLLPPHIFGFHAADPKYQGEFGAMRREWDQAQSAYSEALGKAKTPDERQRVRAESEPNLELFAERSLKLAETQPDTLAGVTALCWVVGNAPTTEPGKKALAILKDGGLAHADPNALAQALDANRHARRTPLAPLVLDLVMQKPDNPQAARLLTWVCTNYFGDNSPEDAPIFAEAAKLIVDQFADSPDITNFCECLGFGGSPPWAWKYEKHMRTILDKNQHRRVRVAAQFALASAIQSKGETRQDEAEKLYQQFVTDFDGRAQDPVEEALLGRAKGEVMNIRARGLGKPAPEMAGEDLDGLPMKLSDFRGKVVLISFWATSCAPCMKLVPHERSLATRFKDKPFAIVGVNGDNGPEGLRKAKETEITWRSFKDQRVGETVISVEWGVSGWPTLYLIDHKGIIRQRWNSPDTEVLDREISKLVEAAVRDK